MFQFHFDKNEKILITTNNLDNTFYEKKKKKKKKGKKKKKNDMKLFSTYIKNFKLRATHIVNIIKEIQRSKFIILLLYI